MLHRQQRSHEHTPQQQQQQKAEGGQQDEDGSSQRVDSTTQRCDTEVVCLPIVSRRKLSVGEAEGAGDDSAERVHPSLKRFHWMVTNMVEIADELIFRKIVSYL